MKQFQSVRVQKPQSSVFDLSHERKLTMNMADLVPVFMQEVLPGDRFQVSMEALVRFQPLIAPIMHRVNVYMHFFFVPNRIIWNEWEDFITGGKDGTLTPVHPRFTGTGAQAKSKCDIHTLGDYLGLPSQRYDGGEMISPLSQLPFRAYQNIYNEYYRDQTMQDEISFSIGSINYNIAGADADKMTTLRKRCWEKDYFTSALPWAQRGAEVKIPIAGSAPVSGMPTLYEAGTTTLAPSRDLQSGVSAQLVGIAGDTKNLQFGGSLAADLEGASSTTIRDLRSSYAIQRWLEKNARAGSRYIEQILSHFGVKSSDSRLQRPEYLGGGKMPVQISEVLQQSATEVASPQGNMTGHGITAGTTSQFYKFFEEHGIVLGIMSIMPRTAYQDGISRTWKRFDRFDYYFPEFAHIGEQPVRRGEVYHSDLETTNAQTFGYQERYAEYRFNHDTVHGDFRDSLDFWHMGRKFLAAPTLNASFVQADPTDRIYPARDPEFKKILVQLYTRFHARRPIPKFGTPLP